MRFLLAACCFFAVIALFLEAFPLGDSSGEEEDSDSESLFQTLPNGEALKRACQGLIWRLRATAARWKEQLCKEQNVCKGSMEMMVQNNLHLPKITPEDGCSHTGFQKEACLRRLSSSLYAYRAYLEYIDDTFSKSEEGAGSLWPITQQLADNLKSMISDPDTVTVPPPVTQDMISAKLREQIGWNITVIKHLILQDFTSFMEKTARAFRLL
ncbi:interleukin-6 isoform X1 [Sceloporus undulatus]|uniref:interleukin-6 isoform X1 n=1 Tax=Sceloporus undulatus TaxID=8520 RepID=UPI001C4A8AA8|nr:interleukin-6 isoform X1 [Sceloporus undulatus]